MGTADVIFLTEATFLVFGVIFSFFVILPMSYNYSEYSTGSKSRCLLFAEGVVVNKSTEFPVYDINRWGDPGLCAFGIGLAGVVLVWSLIILCVTSSHLIKGSTWSWLPAFFLMAVNAVLFVLILASALTVSLGFRKWCQTITRSLSRCREVEVYFQHSKDNGDFYILYTMAIIGCWASWISYLVLLVTSVRRLCLYHRVETMALTLRRRRRQLLQRWGRRSSEYDVL